MHLQSFIFLTPQKRGPVLEGAKMSTGSGHVVLLEFVPDEVLQDFEDSQKNNEEGQSEKLTLYIWAEWSHKRVTKESYLHLW